MLVATILALAAPGAAMAVDYNVNTIHDFFPVGACDPAPGGCTLREAVAVATAPQDRVILPAGHYNLTQGELVLQTDIIVGAGARTTIIDALDNSRAVRINAEATGNSISGVTITHGNGVGASGSSGGGVFVGGSATLTLLNSHVVDNTGSTSGGGIAVAGGLVMVGSTVARNRAIGSRLAAAGGGIVANAGTSVAIGNSTISDNVATEASSLGGGIAAGGRSRSST